MKTNGDQRRPTKTKHAKFDQVHFSWNSDEWIAEKTNENTETEGEYEY